MGDGSLAPARDRLDVDTYHRMAEAGIFGADDRETTAHLAGAQLALAAAQAALHGAPRLLASYRLLID